MDENQLTGKWIGIYTQELKPDDDRIIEVDFEIELNSTEGAFNGVCHDLEIEEGRKEKSSIKGFVDDRMISFVLPR